VTEEAGMDGERGRKAGRVRKEAAELAGKSSTGKNEAAPAPGQRRCATVAHKVSPSMRDVDVLRAARWKG
jgi:hypothetical protein